MTSHLIPQRLKFYRIPKKFVFWKMKLRKQKIQMKHSMKLWNDLIENGNGEYYNMLYNIMLCNITEHIIEFKIKTYSNDFLDDSFSSSLPNFYLSTYLYVLIRIKPILKWIYFTTIIMDLRERNSKQTVQFTFSKFDTGRYYLHSNKTPIKRPTTHIYSMNRKWFTFVHIRFHGVSCEDMRKKHFRIINRHLKPSHVL